MTRTTPILVLGGTGKTGRRVVERLRAARRAGCASARAPDSRRSTGRTASTWAPALEGASRRLRLLLPRPRGARRARGRGRAGAARACAAASGGWCCSPAAARRRRERAEQRRRRRPASTGRSCAARGSTQNFSEGYMLDPILGGEVALPAGDVPEPFVDADDIADVAVAALTEDGHAGELYELTGPRAADVRRGGRRDRPGDRPRARATSRSRSTSSRPRPPSRASRPTWSGCSATCSARCSTAATRTLADGVQRALGREPRDFADFAREAAATGAFNA